MISGIVSVRKFIISLSSVKKVFTVLFLGGLSGLGMAPWNQFFLLLIGFTGLLWLIQSAKRASKAAILGWLFGIGHFFVSCYWVGEAFLVDAPRYGWLAPFAIFFLALLLGLFSSGPALLTWMVNQKLNVRKY